MIEFGPYTPSLTTIFIRILDESAALVWNKSTKTFIPYNAGDAANFNVQMHDPSGLGIYTPLDPIEITTPGSYPVIVYLEPETQIGGKVVGWTASGPVDEVISTEVRSYTSPGAADVYFASRLNASGWTLLTDANAKQQALNDATRIINSFAYIGAKTVSTQAFEWPRSGIVGLDSTIVPQPIVEAQYEIAYALLIDGFEIDREQRGLYVTQRRYAGVSTSYKVENIPQWLLWGIPSWLAWALLYPFFDFGRPQGIRLNRVS